MDLDASAAQCVVAMVTRDTVVCTESESSFCKCAKHPTSYRPVSRWMRHVLRPCVCHWRCVASEDAAPSDACSNAAHDASSVEQTSLVHPVF